MFNERNNTLVSRRIGNVHWAMLCETHVTWRKARFDSLVKKKYIYYTSTNTITTASSFASANERDSDSDKFPKAQRICFGCRYSTLTTTANRTDNYPILFPIFSRAFLSWREFGCVICSVSIVSGNETKWATVFWKMRVKFNDGAVCIACTLDNSSEACEQQSDRVNDKKGKNDTMMVRASNSKSVFKEKPSA